MSPLNLMTAMSAAALLGAAACSRSTETTSTPSIAPAPATTPASDGATNTRLAQGFVNAAGQAGLVDVEAGKLALAHAIRPDVKSFAQLIIDDHTSAAKALKAAAAVAALAPPSETLDDAHLRLVNDRGRAWRHIRRKLHAP